MKASLLIILSILSFTTLAGENYAAKELKLGTIVEITNDINFGDRTTGVFIQDGKALNKSANALLDLEADNSKCFLTVLSNDYNPDTRTTRPLKKGEIYQIDHVEQDFFSKGRVQINLSSGSGRKVFLDCDKSQTAVTKIGDKTGMYFLHMPNLTFIKINNVKKSLENLIEIKD